MDALVFMSLVYLSPNFVKFRFCEPYRKPGGETGLVGDVPDGSLETESSVRGDADLGQGLVGHRCEVPRDVLDITLQSQGE